VAIRYVDRAGRKPLLLGGALVMALSLTILGLASLLFSQSGAVAWITVACLTLYIAGFATSWGPIVWVMLAEIFPLKVRGAMMAVGTVVLWGANFVVSLTFPVLLDWWGPGPVFLGYAMIGVLAFLFTRTFVTETKGRSLEQIEADLRGRAVV